MNIEHEHGHEHEKEHENEHNHNHEHEHEHEHKLVVHIKPFRMMIHIFCLQSNPAILMINKKLKNILEIYILPSQLQL